MGQPQIGAAVELLNAGYQVVAQTFTDDKGRYALPNVGGGVYQVKATGTLFLPTLRQNVRLLTNTRLVINLTLSTFEQAAQWLPAQPRTADTPEDDWDWTLRLSTNRPLLRMLDPAVAQAAAMGGSPDLAGPVILDTGSERGAESKAGHHQIAARTGLRSFGEGGTTEGGSWITSEHAGHGLMFHAATGIDPEQGRLSRMETTMVYQQELSPDRTVVTVASVTQHLEILGAGGDQGLVTARVRSATTMHMGDLAMIEAGTEFAADRLGDGGFVTGSHPFGSLAVHAGNTTVRYAVATAPGVTDAEHLDPNSETSTQNESQISEVDGRLLMTHGLHQELSLIHNGGKLTSGLAVFHDRLLNPAVQGAAARGTADSFAGDLLYDPTSGMIAVSGHGYSGGGVMAMLHDQLSPDTWLSLQAAIGQAQAIAPGFVQGSLPTFAAQQSPMVAVSAGTTVPVLGSKMRAGYRWQPTETLSPVAPFSADVPGAYLSFTLRQPLHFDRNSATRLEAFVDVRNLLAEGYRPFLSADGSTVIFAQAQRCIAAGFTFSF